ncbi:histidine phosphatase family protein [Ferdinandcohnia sp. SAFN-114]
MGTCDYMVVYLVRHGITAWNKEKRYLGHTDIEIIRGEQSGLIKLKKELTHIHFDHIFTSDLRRCQESLKLLNIPAPETEDDRLRELDFGDWEGKTYDELKDQKAYQNWLNNWEKGIIPNGESTDTFSGRIDAFFNERFQQTRHNETILIMTHGGVIRYVVSKYVSSLSFWEVTIPNGHCIRLTFKKNEGGWTCSSLSAVPSQEKGKS